MIECFYRKLAAWPQRDTTERKSKYQFKATYADTLKALEYELDRIEATDVILEGLLTSTKMRRDGWPLTDTAFTHPGMRLSWQSNLVGPGELMTDEYETWQANLRAIALTMEALRAVGRWGTMKRRQQYKGLLPSSSPAPNTGTFMSYQQAASYISEMAGGGAGMEASVILASSLSLRAVYRLAARNLHPDKQSGDHEKFVRLETARQMVEEYQSLYGDISKKPGG